MHKQQLQTTVKSSCFYFIMSLLHKKSKLLYVISIVIKSNYRVKQYSNINIKAHCQVISTYVKYGTYMNLNLSHKIFEANL